MYKNQNYIIKLNGINKILQIFEKIFKIIMLVKVKILQQLFIKHNKKLLIKIIIVNKKIKKLKISNKMENTINNKKIKI